MSALKWHIRGFSCTRFLFYQYICISISSGLLICIHIFVISLLSKMLVDFLSKKMKNTRHTYKYDCTSMPPHWFSTVPDRAHLDSALSRTVLILTQHFPGQGSSWFITVCDSAHLDSALSRTVLILIYLCPRQCSSWFSIVTDSSHLDLALS